MTTLKDKFLLHADKFDPMYKAIFEVKGQPSAEEAEVALALLEEPDSPQKGEVTTNIDNLVKVANVIQFQTEAMCEYIRAFVGPIAQSFFEDKVKDEEIVPMFLFIQDKIVILHNQLDFFFGNFQEEDLTKGFSLGRRSVSEMAYSQRELEKKTVDFLRQIRTETVTYLQLAQNLHEWVHGLLQIIDEELQERGVQGFVPTNDH